MEQTEQTEHVGKKAFTFVIAAIVLIPIIGMILTMPAKPADANINKTVNVTKYAYLPKTNSSKEQYRYEYTTTKGDNYYIIIQTNQERTFYSETSNITETNDPELKRFIDDDAIKLNQWKVKSPPNQNKPTLTFEIQIKDGKYDKFNINAIS